MLRPDADGFNLFTLLPILAAILYALAMLLTRTKCQDESPLILSLSLNVAFVFVGGVVSIGLIVVDLEMATISKNLFLMGGWVRFDITGFFALVVMASAMLIGSIFAAIAYQSAPSSTVSSFDYAYLVFGILWGSVFFAEFPDGLTMLGMAMIAAAGIVAVRR